MVILRHIYFRLIPYLTTYPGDIPGLIAGGKMNTKRFIAASIAVFIVNQICDFIVHGAILGKTYEALQNIWRPDMMSKMWILYITSFIFSFLFVYIFIKGYENKGIAEGVRFGIITGLFMNVIGMFNQYAIYPVPLTLAVQWFIFAMIQFIIYGITAALIYRPK